ncbi:MAG: hypothetical protein KA354_13235 [Phycisphaerae bacterium]|nr:hypothetical protein [Phycisphaerae bacterium]
MASHRLLHGLACVALIGCGATEGWCADPIPPFPGPQPQESLRPMLKIAWKKGPDLPQGFQDSDGGIVGRMLVTVGGFCSGQKGVPGKDTVYPRGFLKKVWGLSLAESSRGWQPLPDFPGEPRQELFAIVVDETLYGWGGFSYTKPYCYKDGYRLSLRAGKWVWDSLPDLPSPAASSGVCAVGTRIYVCGGCDYDADVNDGTFFTSTDRTGSVKRQGTRLLVIDTADLKAGWRELDPCPGTPRWIAAMTAVKGKIYVIGGATGNDNRTKSYCTVVDNWVYDPPSRQWSRIRDLPIASGNFPSGRIVFADRYILLVGGNPYDKVMNPDGSARDPYGQPFKYYKNKSYYSDMLVYDTRTGEFGTADPLPLNNNLPMTVVEDRRIHLIGGETGGCEIEGEVFGHHPDLYLVGTIQETK